MAKFKIIDNKVILHKEITMLDEFVIETIGIVANYTNYVIIGGYAAIFFGRARATEDIDIFIQKLSFEDFSEMYDEFLRKGFEFTIEDKKSLYYDYLLGRLPINVWRKNLPLLRLEIKIPFKESQKKAFVKPVTVNFGNYALVFAQFESQIAYKRYILKSEKDLEDARHLELVFDGLDSALIQEYKKEFEYSFTHGI